MKKVQRDRIASKIDWLVEVVKHVTMKEERERATGKRDQWRGFWDSNSVKKEKQELLEFIEECTKGGGMKKKGIKGPKIQPVSEDDIGMDIHPYNLKDVL